MQKKPPSYQSSYFRLSLRNWLFIFYLLAMLPVLLFAAHTINRISNAQIAANLDDLQRQNHLLTQSIQGEIEAAHTALRILSAGTEIDDKSLMHLYDHAKSVVKSNPHFWGIALTDASGQLLFKSNLAFGKSELKPGYPELIAQVFKTGLPNLSGVYETPLDGRKIVAISAPVMQDAHVAYCLRLGLNVESFSSLITKHKLPIGWIAVLMDGQNKIVASSIGTSEFFEPNTLPTMLAASRKTNDGQIEVIPPNGVAITMLVQTIPGADWRLAVGIPATLLSAPRTQLLRELLVLAVAWLALSFLLSQILADRLLRKLNLVASLMKKNFDVSTVNLRVTEFWHILQIVVANQRNAQLLANNLSDASRQRDEVNELYDQAPCGYYSVDVNGRIIRINQTISVWLGYRPDEMLGYRSRDFLAGEGKNAFKKNFPSLMAQAKVKNLELAFVRKDGTEMPALISAEAVFDNAEQFLSIRVVVFDNTERKQAQQALADVQKREMETGRQIQRTLLSTPQLPAYAGLWLSSFSQASRGVDGDFLDVTYVGDHLLDVVAGDVMGKGVPAALMGAAIKLQFSRSKSELFAQRETRTNPPQPADIVTAVNRAIAPQLQALEAFATLVYLRVDTRANSLTWVGCGHEEGLLISPSGIVRRLANQHPPLGLLTHENCTQDVCELNNDDALFLCSDGAADALLASGERLGREPVIAIATGHVRTHRTPAMALHAIRRDLLPEGATLTDDLTMLLLSHQPHPASGRLELPIALASLLPLREFVTHEALNAGMDEVSASLLSVAAVELLTNVIAHGQRLLENAPIEVITEPIDGGLVLEFKYLGERFEYLETPTETDFSSYPESGLGLHIIRTVSSQINYSFEDGVNSVRLLLRSPSQIP
jgi:PAS domain S-box-containing protein